MKIVYHCFGGAHASPTAAAIHLGILPKDRWPSFTDFQKIPFFDDTTSITHGKMVKVGQDYLGNEVYIMGRRNCTQLALNIIREYLKLTGEDPGQYLFVSCVQMLNPFMVTGGFSSRGMGWVGFGRPIVTFGTILSFRCLVSIVNRTIQDLERIKGI